MHDMLGVHAAQGRCIHAAHLLLERAVEQVDVAELAFLDHAAHVYAERGVPLRHLIRGRLRTRCSPAQPPAEQQRVPARPEDTLDPGSVQMPLCEKYTV